MDRQPGCGVGSASALVTFICVLCTLRTHISLSINMRIRFYRCVDNGVCRRRYGAEHPRVVHRAIAHGAG
jgi:hypothetical protein